MNLQMKKTKLNHFLIIAKIFSFLSSSAFFKYIFI